MRLEIEEVKIDKNKVLNFLGYASRKIPPIIERKIDEEIERVHNLLQPVAFIKQFQITQIKDNTTYFGEGYCLKSEYLANELENASSLYLVVYTIGDQIEDQIRAYSKGSEMIRAMILDKIGIVALDHIRQQIKTVILEEVHPYKIAAQLFPGTKDFHISNQKVILDVFQEENNIISISKYHQLNPIKTVAALFGIGQIEDKQNMCDRCNSRCFT